MEQNALLNMHLLLLLIIWTGIICIYAVLRRAKLKILSARSIEDLIRFRCSTAKKNMSVVGKYRTFFLVLLIITSLILIVDSGLRTTLLIGGQTVRNMEIGELLRKLVNPIFLLDCLSSIGLYVIAQILLIYFNVLIQKCREIGLAEKE